VDARNFEHRLAAAFPPAAVSEILELTEQGHGFPVGLIGDFLKPALQLVDPLILNPVPREQLSFCFGNQLSTALLHFGSKRGESLPDCCAEFSIGHLFLLACQQAVDVYPTINGAACSPLTDDVEVTVTSRKMSQQQTSNEA
jgi:hypothetical protein